MTIILFAHESMGQELQRDSERQFICVSHGVSWGGFMWRWRIQDGLTHRAGTSAGMAQTPGDCIGQLGLLS